MSDILIEAHGLGKKYHRGYFARRGRKRGSDEFWALKDIDLELRAGEALGIIGPNGAGKSTLLKILSRVTVPSEGWLTVRGRVGALIELGAGFHPELTGRDNVYIAGSILGMPRKEITRRFEEILEFAEIGEFIDMPVKKYSSGMYVRLGFAVAAHMDPEILLVDEVLAVGDGAFQKKCFGAMQRFREQGVSVILVSHSMYNIQRNCERTLLLVSGHGQVRGATDEVIGQYQALLDERAEEGQSIGAIAGYEESLSRDIEITHVQIRDASDKPARAFDTGDEVALHVGYKVNGDDAAFHAEVSIQDSVGQVILTDTTYLNDTIILPHGEGGEFVWRVMRMPLTAGPYSFAVQLLDESSQVHHDVWAGLHREGLRFSVRPNQKSVRLAQWRGVLDTECRWATDGSALVDAAADLLEGGTG